MQRTPDGKYLDDFSPPYLTDQREASLTAILLFIMPTFELWPLRTSAGLLDALETSDRVRISLHVFQQEAFT